MHQSMFCLSPERAGKYRGIWHFQCFGLNMSNTPVFAHSPWCWEKNWLVHNTRQFVLIKACSSCAKLKLRSNENNLELDESWWLKILIKIFTSSKFIRVHESRWDWQKNTSGSCNSHQLSSLFAWGFNCIRYKTKMAAHDSNSIKNIILLQRLERTRERILIKFKTNKSILPLQSLPYWLDSYCKSLCHT